MIQKDNNVLVREGDRIVYKRYNQDVIIDCIEPSTLHARMQKCYSEGFARYIAYHGAMSTLEDVIEVARIAGKEKPLITKNSNDAEFGCTGKIYAKKGL